MKKALFICKKRVDEYGISYGLVNSATFASNYLNHIGIESKVIVLPDYNAIDRAVTEYDPSHIFLEAIWVTPHKIHELLKLKRHKNRKWIVRIHSKIPFIANEGIAFEWINHYIDIANNHSNLIIAPNSEEFAHDLTKIYKTKSILYLPNIYIPTNKISQNVDNDKNIIHIGCFGAIRPLKNTLIQAVAAIKFADNAGKTLHFHVNSNRHEQNGDQVYKNIRNLFEGNPRHKLIEHKWMSHENFLQCIAKMDIGMQVSMSESFDIVVADMVSVNVPVVVSKEIDWLPKMFTAKIGSSENIENMMWINWSLSKFGLKLINKLYLLKWNISAKKIWRNFINPH